MQLGSVVTIFVDVWSNHGSHEISTPREKDITTYRTVSENDELDPMFFTTGNTKAFC